jgi:hypothetical protein
MRIFRIHENEQNQFAESPEIAMDLNFGRSGSNFYLVVSCRMAVLLDENTFAEPEDNRLNRTAVHAQKAVDFLHGLNAMPKPSPPDAG